MKICLIDNYDSFTFNVEHQLLMLDHEVDVIRNDKISIDEISQLDYDAFVIGPGPSNPKNAGISLELINYFYDKKPILGICLGHQCIGEVFGGKIVIADKIMHGKTSNLSHTKSSFFQNIKEQSIKDQLIKLTNDAFQKEVFGTPTFIVNNKIFWGQDRLEYALEELNSN